MSKCNSLFQQKQEADALREYNEYRAEGGKLDLTDWCVWYSELKAEKEGRAAEARYQAEHAAEEARLEMDILSPSGDEHTDTNWPPHPHARVI